MKSISIKHLIVSGVWLLTLPDFRFVALALDVFAIQIYIQVINGKTRTIHYAPTILLDIILSYSQQGDQGVYCSSRFFIDWQFGKHKHKRTNVTTPKTYSEYQSDRHQFDHVTLNIWGEWYVYYATTICTIWIMISMDGGIGHSMIKDATRPGLGMLHVRFWRNQWHSQFTFFLKLYFSIIFVLL